MVDYRNVELIIDNNAIKHIKTVKLLGDWLDNNLTVTTHYIKLR